MELALSNAIQLQAMISDVKLLDHTLDRTNPFIIISLKIWRETQKLWQLQDSSKILRWCAFDNNFLPNSSDKRFYRWVGQGITAYCTLFHKGVMKSFETVKEEINLEQQDFYRFLQVRHYVGSITKNFNLADLE